jgi:signal transduction histidine kinase
MATTQVLDQRTRRVLHDEVLPSIHAAMLSLASGGDPSLPQALPQGKGRSTATGQAAETAVRQLSEVHAQLADLLHELPPSITPEIARLGLFGALRRVVEIEFGQAFASVEWSCQEGVEKRAGALSPVVAETVYFAARELVRNAARHARPAQGPEDLRLKITARVDGESLSLVVEDNGADPVGSPPGANGWTAETAGTEHGLALHGTMMAIVGGSLALEKCPDQKTRAQLTIPVEAGRRL